MKLLLVEDNRRISEFMIQGLEESGFFVTLAENGTHAREQMTNTSWDIIILDIMLPDIDGLQIIQYARFKQIKTPILVVSALDTPEDKVRALNYGADDYLAKPFDFRELIARVNALGRRAQQTQSSTPHTPLLCQDLLLDVEQHRIERAGKVIELTLQEFKLLYFLMQHMDKVVSKTEILNAVWGHDFLSNTNVVEVYISYLRTKIETKDLPKLIETVKGRGYIIRSLPK